MSGVLDLHLAPGEDAKSLGAYYTDAQVAEFLVGWAVRKPSDRVMDPGFGDGVFLRSACRRLLALGGSPATQIYGVEIDPRAYRRTASRLAEEFGVVATRLYRLDFFWLDRGAVEIDAIVGNPPFVRYQRFSGEARRQALECARAEGVRLSELCSSWAAFVVHSSAMLRRGGRLAMVVPAEIGYAAYARPVLRYLRETFREITLIGFRKKLFPDLSEETLLLLADDRGAGAGEFRWLEFRDAGELSRFSRGRIALPGGAAVAAESLISGTEKLVAFTLSGSLRRLYDELRRHPMVQPLGGLADVGIGYVTGANDFFHLAPEEATRRRIPAEFLRPAVRRGRSLAGLRFTTEDWKQGAALGEAGYLLHVNTTGALPDAVREYVREGERRQVHRAYKCRTRSPWYRVPHVHHPDALLTYMSGNAPRLVANEAGVVAPNSLHVVRIHPAIGLTGSELAALWQTSLVRLSTELEGHSLGGGMLKLEPTEAERVLVPVPDDSSDLTVLADEMDHLVRRGREAEAAERADHVILQQRLGLTKAECRALREAASALRDRRYRRGAAQ